MFVQHILVLVLGVASCISAAPMPTSTEINTLVSTATPTPLHRKLRKSVFTPQVWRKKSTMVTEQVKSDAEDQQLDTSPPPAMNKTRAELLKMSVGMGPGGLFEHRLKRIPIGTSAPHFKNTTGAEPLHVLAPGTIVGPLLGGA